MASGFVWFCFGGSIKYQSKACMGICGMGGGRERKEGKEGKVGGNNDELFLYWGGICTLSARLQDALSFISKIYELERAPHFLVHLFIYLFFIF